MAYRSRERTARILAHQEADRVPFDRVGFPLSQAQEWFDELGLGEEERECFSQGDFRYLTFNLALGREKLAPYLPDLPDGAELRGLTETVAAGGGLVVQFYNLLLTTRVLDNLKQFVESFFGLARYR